MKGSAESVLPLVMGVIIAAAVLMIGFGIIGKAKEGVDDIWNTGANYQQRMEAMSSIHQACNDWMTGAEKYKAEAILETYELPDNMRPYKAVWSACGESIEDLAQECYSKTESSGDCAGQGYVIASSTEISDCLSTCTVITKIYSQCKLSCPDRLINCFESLLQPRGHIELKREDMDFLNPRSVEDACE